MGRNYEGCMLNTECARIELSYLLKHKLIVKDSRISLPIRWGNGWNISVVSYYSDSESYLKLSYKIKMGGVSEDIEYKVRLVELNSNLGKGKVLYMLCPFSNKLCRILYLGYDSKHFKSRYAYRNRIYYVGQLSSKQNRFNEKYWHLIRREESKRRKQIYYNGIKTKWAIRHEKTLDKIEEFEIKRWTELSPKLYNEAIQYGFIN